MERLFLVILLLVRINHENKEKKSIIEELTFDLESTDDTEEEKNNAANLSASTSARIRQQNKVHILKQKVPVFYIYLTSFPKILLFFAILCFQGWIDRHEWYDHQSLQDHKGTQEKKVLPAGFPPVLYSLSDLPSKFIMNQVVRFVYFEEGIMYIMCQTKKNAEFMIKSVTSLDRLFKVYLEVRFSSD